MICVNYNIKYINYKNNLNNFKQIMKNMNIHIIRKDKFFYKNKHKYFKIN